MSVQETLAVPYHQQDTSVYCGAACAQMVLDSIAVGAGLLGQDVLYTDERNHTSELASWYSPPDGLQWVMNDRRPAGFAGWFDLLSLSIEDAVSRKLVWTIHHYHVAPIALVFGGDHWVVVRGYEASAAPSDSGDTSYTIIDLEINNPWPPVPTPPVAPPPPPPPHSDGTDGCGSGGNRGTADTHIAYATWQSDYMTRNKYGTLWNGKYVALCDPEPPAERPGPMPKVGKRLSGERLLESEQAVELAMSGLRQYGLYERKEWRKALRNTKPGTPSFVQRLDRIDSFYCIVPFERRQRIVTAAVAVDGRFGDYQQTIALPAGGSSILTGLDKKTILDMTIGHTLQLEDRMERLTVRKEAFCLYPMLVWQPCLESLSPFYPFHMMTVGNNKIYIRVDGCIFTTLHTNIPGI